MKGLIAVDSSTQVSFRPQVSAPVSAPVNAPVTPTQAEATYDAFLTALRHFTRPPTHPLPSGFMMFDKDNLAQLELAALMGYEGIVVQTILILRKVCMKLLSLVM